MGGWGILVEDRVEKVFYWSFMVFTFRIECRLKMKRQSQHCGTKVRCRQKCTNTFPVPEGNTACTGTFEGDSCTVLCGTHYRHRGDSVAYCSGGVWKTQRLGGRPASAHCVSVGAYQHELFGYYKGHSKAH